MCGKCRFDSSEIIVADFISGQNRITVFVSLIYQMFDFGFVPTYSRWIEKFLNFRSLNFKSISFHILLINLTFVKSDIG